MTEPQTLPAVGFARRERTEINRLIAAVKKMRPISVPGTRLAITANGTSRITTVVQRSSSGGHWD